MYKFLTLTCVSLFVVSVYSVVERLPKQEPPEKYAGQPGCYSPEEDIMLPEGIPYSPIDGKRCIRYICGPNDIQLATCGVLVTGNCTVTQDFTKPYPECCPIISNCDGPATAVA